MRGILEITLAATILWGAGDLILERVRYEVAKAAAEKVVEQRERSLGDYTRRLTRGKSKRLKNRN